MSRNRAGSAPPRVSLAAALATAIAALAHPVVAPAERAYVSNEDDGSVTVVDTARLQVIGTFQVGKRPRGLALSRDAARLYVAITGLPKCPPPMPEEECTKHRDPSADGIAVVATAALTETGIFKGVSDPERVALSHDGRALLVSEEDSAQLCVLDAARGSVIARIKVGGEPEGVRASPNGRYVVVTSESDNTVSIIDAAKYVLLRTVAVGKRPRDLAFSPDSHLAFVSGEGDASVYRVALPSGSPSTQFVQLREDARPMGVVFDPKRGRLYVSTGHGGTVAVISAKDAALLGEIQVGGRPWGIALADGGARLLAATGPSGTVVAIDTRTLSVVGKVRVGHGPWGVVVGP